MIFLLFLVVSSFFWTLQSLQEVTEYSFSIPLAYDSVPPQLMVANQLPQELQVTVRDRGLLLWTYFKQKKNMTIPVHPTDWYQGEGKSNVQMSMIESAIRRR
jgi:hypothetical protein